MVETPSPLRMLGKAYLDAWKSQGRFTGWHDQFCRAIAGYARVTKSTHSNPRMMSQNPFPRKDIPHRVVDACKFDFAEIRAIKNAVPGATINDVVWRSFPVVYASISTAKGGDAGKQSGDGLPNRCAFGRGERSAGGNMAGFMNVALCSDVDDPRGDCRRSSRKPPRPKHTRKRWGRASPRILPT